MALLRLFSLSCTLAAMPVSAYESDIPDDWPAPITDNASYGMLLADRVELAFAGEHELYAWDIHGWYGGDTRRWWLKTEGEGEQWDSSEEIEIQLLYSRMFSSYWDWQVGLHHDIRPASGRSHLAFGLQGLAPYLFEVNSVVFVSETGDISLRLEAEYDLRLTQRIVLQPRAELDAAFSSEPETGLQRGINTIELDLRLRYELKREVAPYIGVSLEKLFADTADLARAAGEPDSVTSLVVGVRAWF